MTSGAIFSSPGMEHAEKELNDFLIPIKEEIEVDARKTDALLLSFNMAQMMMTEVRGNTQAVYGYLQKAFDLSMKPPAMLMSSMTCPSVDEAIQEAHEAHLAVGKVVGHLGRRADETTSQPKLLGVIERMHRTITDAIKEIQDRIENLAERREQAQKGGAAELLAWAKETTHYKIRL